MGVSRYCLIFRDVVWKKNWLEEKMKFELKTYKYNEPFSTFNTIFRLDESEITRVS